MTFLFRCAASAVLLAGLSACGTTYQLPTIDAAKTAQAKQMFATAQTDKARPQLSASAAKRRFARVAPRIERVGESVCKAATAERKNFNCDVDIAIDYKLKQRNAYFTYKDQKPVIRITEQMLQDTRSDDEVAFILGHEYGHLIGRHIQKQQQQAIAGALILGAITAAATSSSSSYGTTYNQSAVNSAVELGAAAGSMAYSQTYELESDTLGARITHAAGYDPVKGAAFFARPEKAKSKSGKLSFWGTHPPDEKRLATVLATVDQIESNVGLKKVQ